MVRFISITSDIAMVSIKLLSPLGGGFCYFCHIQRRNELDRQMLEEMKKAAEESGSLE